MKSFVYFTVAGLIIGSILIVQGIQQSNQQTNPAIEKDMPPVNNPNTTRYQDGL